MNRPLGDVRVRTNIEIDEGLMREALAVSGLGTKRAVVEEGARLLIRLKGQEQVRALFGQIHWEGDLEARRLGRASET